MRIERRRLGGALCQGVLAGALYGLFQGLGEGSLLVGVISGLFFGLVMTAGFYSASRAGEHLAGLSYRQKRTVLGAVRRGEPVVDPRLAEPTIRQAQRVRASVGHQRLGVVVAGGLLALSVLGLGLALVFGDSAGAAAAGFSMVAWAVILLVGPPLDDARRRTHEQRRKQRQTSCVLRQRPLSLEGGPGRDRRAGLRQSSINGGFPRGAYG